MNKQEIRAEIRRRRRELGYDEWLDKSQIICENIWNLREYKHADLIYVYMAKEGEVHLDELMKDAWKHGKKVAVPKVLGKGMEFYEIQSLKDVKEGYMGIREPITNTPASGKSPLFIMPAVALDEQKHRIGYGGGFYDRFLERHPQKIKIAAAFEFQIFDRVPYEAFDILPDKIITEQRMI